MTVGIKQKIADAFINLCKKKDPGKITVRDIVSECGVSRQTFYYYYEDIYDLVAFAIEGHLQRIAGESTALDGALASAEHFIGDIMDCIPMIRRVFESKLRPDVESMLLKTFRKYFRELIDSNIREVSITSREMTYLCDFLACSLLGEVISNCELLTMDVPEYCRQLLLLVHSRIDRH